MPLNTIVDLISLLRGKSPLALDSQNQQKLLDLSETKPLLLHIIHQRYGREYTRMVQRAQDRRRAEAQRQGRGAEADLINVHDQRLLASRQKTIAWLKTTVELPEALTNQNKFAQLQTLREDLHAFVQNSEKQHFKKEPLNQYIDFFIKEYEGGATGWDDLIRVVLYAKSTEASPVKKKDRAENLLSALLDAMTAYTEPDFFFKGTTYSCMPGLHERVLDAAFMYVPINPHERDAVTDYCDHILGTLVGNAEGYSGWGPTPLLKTLYLDAQKSADKLEEGDFKHLIFQGWVQDNSTLDKAIDSWIEKKNMLLNSTITGVFARFEQTDLDKLRLRLSNKLSELPQYVTGKSDRETEAKRRYFAGLKQQIADKLNPVVTLAMHEEFKLFINNHFDDQEATDLISKMTSPTDEDIEAIKTDKRGEVKQLKTGEILHDLEFNEHFQGLYKTTTQPYCQLRDEAEAAKQILDRMIEATGLSLEHFQALNVLIALEFSKDCTPLMNALGEAIELDSRRIDNASEELERFKASMIYRLN